MDLNVPEIGTPGQRALELNARTLSTPEQLEALERNLAEQAARESAERLRRQPQAALDSDAQQERELLGAWPGKMKGEGREAVRVLVLGGILITLWVRY